jgi:hypothetical protein
MEPASSLGLVVPRPRPLLTRLLGRPDDQAQGIEICFTVTHIDTLVMARSGFHHSVNYRAVMAFGHAHFIEDTTEKLRLMDSFIDRVYPGRSRLIHWPTPQELKATAMMGMESETASAKIRDKQRSRRKDRNLRAARFGLEPNVRFRCIPTRKRTGRMPPISANEHLARDVRFWTAEIPLSMTGTGAKPPVLHPPNT